MEKQWFVLQCLVGKENKVLESINARIRMEEMEDYIGEVIVPMEKISEKRNGKSHTVNRKVFPGWILINMALYKNGAEAGEGGSNAPEPIVEVWNFLRTTPGLVPTFLAKRPKALRPEEVEAILTTKKFAEPKLKQRVDFKVGETVKVKEGPFMGLTGTVTMVDPDRGKLKVEVSVFNRMVPVDAEGYQVEKVGDEELVDMKPLS